MSFFEGWNFYLEVGELLASRNLLHLQAQSGRPERFENPVRKVEVSFLAVLLKTSKVGLII